MTETSVSITTASGSSLAKARQARTSASVSQTPRSSPVSIAITRKREGATGSPRCSAECRYDVRAHAGQRDAPAEKSPQSVQRPCALRLAYCLRPYAARAGRPC